MDLAEVLERFNRKERNLLIRAALGQRAQRPLLSESFCKNVASKLDLEVPLGAWWATDYHINWIAGALCAYAEGVERALEPQENPSHRQDEGDGKLRYLVEGNQEDIDLVLATGENLVMIEAKGYGAWSNRQMASKLERLDLLHAYYHKLPQAGAPPIRFHLLITSPHEPEKLHAKWPSWACREQRVPPWIQLDLYDRGQLLGVTRCDEHGLATAAGYQWRVVET